MEYQHISISRAEMVATVTINRPEKANALNYVTLSELEHAALSFREDIDTRVVIFTGAGKHFSSGFDLTDPSAEYEGPLVLRRRRNRIGARAIMAMYNMDQITVAAWNGAAMGGGACIPTALDFRIGSSDCVMRYPEVDGGSGMDLNSFCLALTEVARGSISLAGAVAMQSLMGTKFLHMLGNDDIRERLFEPALRGEKIGAICMTEPNAGSDLGGIATAAVKVDLCQRPANQRPPEYHSLK